MEAGSQEVAPAAGNLSFCILATHARCLRCCHHTSAISKCWLPHDSRSSIAMHAPLRQGAWSAMLQGDLACISSLTCAFQLTCMSTWSHQLHISAHIPHISHQMQTHRQTCQVAHHAPSDQTCTSKNSLLNISSEPATTTRALLRACGKQGSGRVGHVLSIQTCMFVSGVPFRTQACLENFRTSVCV